MRVLRRLWLCYLLAILLLIAGVLEKDNVSQVSITIYIWTIENAPKKEVNHLIPTVSSEHLTTHPTHGSPALSLRLLLLRGRSPRHVPQGKKKKTLHIDSLEKIITHLLYIDCNMFVIFSMRFQNSSWPTHESPAVPLALLSPRHSSSHRRRPREGQCFTGFYNHIWTIENAPKKEFNHLIPTVSSEHLTTHPTHGSPALSLRLLLRGLSPLQVPQGKKKKTLHIDSPEQIHYTFIICTTVNSYIYINIYIYIHNIYIYIYIL